MRLFVYNSSKNPNGPDLEKSKYRIRPRTTVGNPINALNVLWSSFLPRKDFNPIIVAIGILQAAAKQTANPDTNIERKAIL